MNETSRGGGGDGAGGAAAAAAAAAASSTAPSASPAAAAASGAVPAPDPLPSLGMELEDGSMTLSRLLAGESSTHSWGDFDPLAHSSAAGGGSYRPWELDLAASAAAAGVTTAGATMTTAATSLTRLASAPPNVMAPPTSRPSLHHPFYQPPPPAHHYIDQRLPPFQSQFHQQQAEFAAAAAAAGGNQYPLVPAPVQARELPSIHQQFLDERHIHAPPQPPQQGSYHQLQPRTDSPGYPAAPRAQVAKRAGAAPGAAASATIIEQHPTLTAQLRKKTNRAGSLDTGEGDGAGNQPPDTPGQVAAISSTDQAQSGLAGGSGSASGHTSASAPGFKSPATGSSPGGQEKGSKKKRKRCGECTGCQRKDNCGDCAPCRNDKSHQICKVRRCDRLTEKKIRKAAVRQPRSKTGGTGKRGRAAKNQNTAGNMSSSTATTSSSSSTSTATAPAASTAHTTAAAAVAPGAAAFQFASAAQHSASSTPAAATTHWPPTTTSMAAAEVEQWASQHYNRQRLPGAPAAAGFGSGFNGNGYPVGAPAGSPFLGINGNPAATAGATVHHPPTATNLAYNLNLNAPGKFLQHDAATAAAAAAARAAAYPHHPVPGAAAAAAAAHHTASGNFQPGFPVIRPSPPAIGSNPSHPRPLQPPHIRHQPSPNYDSVTMMATQAAHAHARLGSGLHPEAAGNPGSIQHRTENSTNNSNIRRTTSGQSPDSTSFLAYSAEDVPVTPSSTTKDSAPAPLLRIPQLEPIHGSSPSDLATSSELGGTTPHRIGNGGVSAMSEATNDGLARTPSAPRKNNEVSTSFESQWNYVKNCHATPATPNKSRKKVDQHERSSESEVEQEVGPRETKYRGIVKTIQADLKKVKPTCSCSVKMEEEVSGPYYVHLGHARDLAELRREMQERTGLEPEEVRIEKVRYRRKEGRTSHGCPIAKYIVRRRSEKEQLLIVTKNRPGHHCQFSWVVTSIVVWEGIAREEADTAYEVIRDRVGKFGRMTNRRCEANQPKTCACQGLDQEMNGASFTFGCSWSMYFKGCKFGRSSDPDAVRKFKMDDQKTKEYVNVDKNQLENELEQVLGKMATGLSQPFEVIAPDAYKNMTACSEMAKDCRIGFNKNEFGDPKPSVRPFSGVTCVSDFCAHAHRDSTNMVGGCTAVVTLTKPENRGWGAEVDDEQYHVLPHYSPDGTDEYGNRFEFKRRVEEGALEVLEKFERVTAVRDRPSKATKRGHPKPDMKAFLDEHWRTKTGRKRATQGPLNGEGPGPRGSPAKGRRRGRPVKTEESQSTQLVQPQSTQLVQPQQLQHVQQQQEQLQRDQLRLQQQQQRLQQEQQQMQHRQQMWQVAQHNGYPEFNPNLNHTAYPAQNGHLALAMTPAGAGMNQTPPMFPTAPFARFSHIPQTDGNADENDGLDPAAVYNFAPDERTSAVMNGHYGNVAVSKPQNLREFRIHRNPTTTTIDIRHRPQPTAVVPSSILSPPGSDSEFGNSAPRLTATTAAQQTTLETLPAMPPLMRLPPTPPNRTTDVKPEPYIKPEPFVAPQGWPAPQAHFNRVGKEAHPYSSQRLDLTTPFFGGVKQEPKVEVKSEPKFIPQVPQYSISRSAPAPAPAIKEEIKEEIKQEEANSTTIYEGNEPVRVSFGHTDSAENFADDEIGGLAIALTHGSVLFECALEELHATTALKKPNRHKPTRIGLVFYQHHDLNMPKHGTILMSERKKAINDRDHRAIVEGRFSPTKRKLQTLIENGYDIPDDIIRNLVESPAKLPQQQLPQQQNPPSLLQFQAVKGQGPQQFQPLLSPVKHAPWTPQQQQQLKDQVKLPPFDSLHQSPFAFDLLSQLEEFNGGNIESIALEEVQD